MIEESDEYKAMFTPPGQRAAKTEAATKSVDDFDDPIPF